MTAEHQGIILVVDDEVADLGILFEHLQQAGFKVLIAEDGTSAFERVDYMQPDIMLLDLKLPDMDGFELYRQLRKRPQLAEIPVIFLSALTGMAEKLKAFEMSAVDYVTKPFEPEEVVARIDKHLTIRNLRKQLEKTNAQLRQEITEHKQKETALQNSQEQLALITDNIPALIGYVDAHQRYIYVSQAYAEWYVCSKEQVIGKHVKDVLPEETYQRVCQYIETVLQGKRVSFEDKRIDRHGQSRSISVDYVPHFDGQGNVKAFFVLIQDITRYKQLQDALTEAKDAAEAANQAKSMFLANMSHELRTPLNTILGFTQLMERNPQIPLAEQENLGIIQRSGEHLLTLINQVLDLSKIEAGRITLNAKDFDLHHLLDDLKDMFSLKVQNKGIHLIFERAHNVPRYVQIDEVKLRQVLINLLSNAVKFTEEGKVMLHVEMGRRPVSEETAHRQTGRQPTSTIIQFTISDTGQGIDPEEIDAVFEAFRQTESGRRAGEGTGLGLPISRKFVQLMGGDIRVKSEIGQGTTFTFDIRVGLVDQSSITNHQSSISRQIVTLEPGQPRYRLLIVDNKPDNRKLLVNLLNTVAHSAGGSEQGFELREASNGQEAIDIWNTWQPHLIWMDMRMPVMDGYEAAKHIRARGTRHEALGAEKSKQETSDLQNPEPRTQNPIIIAVTASSFEEEQAVILAADCDDFLRKPFHETEVFDLLHKHLGVRFVYEETHQVAGRRSQGGAQGPVPLLTSEALAALPEELRTRLQQAVEAIDLVSALSLIEQTRQHNVSLAEALTKLVKDYRFDILQALFEGK